MKNILFILLAFLSVSFRLYAQDVIKIGIIGLDTSHSTAFTELLNGDSDDKFVKEFEVVATYPYGSKTIQSSYERIPGYIEEVKKHGVEITSSIAELLDKVDCVMLETNDGRIHLEQAMEVFKSGKICYIDKPIGATLGQAIAIYEMAEKYNVPIFSSSALRYSPQNQKLRNGEFGKILGADCYSPHKVEPTHPDFGFYGIHGVETLYTLMGTGCESVNRMSSQDADVVVGRWKDGRIGTFRGIKEGPAIYGGTAYTPKGSIAAGGYEGYKVLLDQILTFFKTGVAPISKEETIEIFTFMKASNMSKEQNGKIVTMEEAYRKGLKDAQKLIKTYK
ncbi:Gfo/Idh/MocA family oxidoreductase [Bacteroides thetaiotaomicron]|nr:Gfo/Idh/MocA family oxidoreductase [Bacteroides thetaiotaomicron]